MHKITVQYFDPADADDFETAYRDRHVPLVQAVPGLERFTISLPHADGAPYLVAELWFADGNALSTARNSAEMATVRADSATYDVARRAFSLGASRTSDPAWTGGDLLEVHRRPRRHTSTCRPMGTDVPLSWTACVPLVLP